MRRRNHGYRDPTSGPQPGECAVCGCDNWRENSPVCPECVDLIPTDLDLIDPDPAAVADLAAHDPWGTAPQPPIGEP